MLIIIKHQNLEMQRKQRQRRDAEEKQILETVCRRLTNSCCSGGPVRFASHLLRLFVFLCAPSLPLLPLVRQAKSA